MKILITGSGTLVGNSISKFLSKKKLNLISTYNKSYPKGLNKKNISIIKYDLKKTLNLKEKNIDALIHCASAIPSQSLSKKEILKVNYMGFKKLVKKCVKKNCKKIILLSTMAVYGEIRSKSVNEKNTIINQDSYGQSKFIMEKHLIKQSKKYGFDYAILRLPGVVGYKSNHNFLSENIKRIKLNKEIFISNPNLLFNNAIHVKNLAMIIFQSLNKKNEESIYNLGSKKKIKLKRVFDLIYKILKKKPKIKFVRSKSKGFNININKILKKKYTIFTTEKCIKLFAKENL